ncbi:MAG TPA: CbtB-domain containing protein [Geminicoccaceae bacterium]|nr:CbtB-domain containing protein [Geminicoccaceae bacterium]
MIRDSVRTQAVAAPRADAIAAAAAVAALLGLFLVYGAGLADPSALHAAAHDARHAFAFPCH